MLSCNFPVKRERAGKVWVLTTYSSDGRSTEGLCIDYDTSNTYALFLLHKVLAQNPMVVKMTAWDKDGNRDERWSFSRDTTPTT